MVHGKRHRLPGSDQGRGLLGHGQYGRRHCRHDADRQSRRNAAGQPGAIRRPARIETRRHRRSRQAGRRQPVRRQVYRYPGHERHRRLRPPVHAAAHRTARMGKIYLRKHYRRRHDPAPGNDHRQRRSRQRNHLFRAGHVDSPGIRRLRERRRRSAGRHRRDTDLHRHAGQKHLLQPEQPGGSRLRRTGILAIHRRLAGVHDQTGIQRDEHRSDPPRTGMLGLKIRGLLHR